MAQMQHAVSAEDAERVCLLLEARFLPNQVLQSGAATRVKHLVEGLRTASEAGAA